MRKSIWVAGALVGSAAGALRAHRLLVERWKRNPDPLEGRTVAFPVGTVTHIETDDGASIRTERAGEGPLVVLVHGLTANRHDWGPVAERLVDSGLSVLAVEQRGHGGSTTGHEGFSAPRLGRDLATVVRELDLRDVVIGGHSMGGIATLSMLAAHHDLHDRISGLALVATTPALDDLRASVSLRVGSLDLTDAVVGLDRGKRTGTGLTVFGSRPSFHMIEEALRQFGQCSDETRKAATGGLRHYDVRAALGAIEIPAIVLAGDRDLLTPLSGNREIARAMPHAELTVYPGTGHMVIWERNVEVAEAIAALRRR